MFVVDTNVLMYAADKDSPYHARCLEQLEGWRSHEDAWFVTWGIVYEFLRIASHPRVFSRPLSANQALDFLEPVLSLDLVTVLIPSPRHEALLRDTVHEFGKPAGNIFHDLHTAVLMREHGVSEIMTADTDFRKFPFLSVTNPVLS